MINCSSNYCLVILLVFRITICKTEDNATTIKIDDSVADDVSGSELQFDPDVCELPIDEGDCSNESLGTNEDSDSDNVINELYELNESNAHNNLNESITFYFGYNKSTKKCEQFNYDGCGGNENRFDTVNECRNACYTPVKNFLAKVVDLLMLRVTLDTSELPAS